MTKNVSPQYLVLALRALQARALYCALMRRLGVGVRVD
jgi:hypothetical protein